ARFGPNEWEQPGASQQLERSMEDE
ncbi:MAG: hypothetical protein QOG30_490, partial [Acidimicrobiaceae bacterium]